MEEPGDGATSHRELAATDPEGQRGALHHSLGLGLQASHFQNHERIIHASLSTSLFGVICYSSRRNSTPTPATLPPRAHCFFPWPVLLLSPFPQLGRTTQPLLTLLIPPTEHAATSPPCAEPVIPCGRSASSHFFIPRDGENSSPGPGMGVVSRTPNIYRIRPN